jgi:predicted DNA-binding transcriptional regulator AlpA
MRDILTIEPRGLNRVKAAAYIDVGTTTFDEMVRDGRMPPPKTIGKRKVWDRRKLDEAFDALPEGGAPNSWDAVLG